MVNIAGNLSGKNPDLNAVAMTAGSHTPQQETERSSITIGEQPEFCWSMFFLTRSCLPQLPARCSLILTAYYGASAHTPARKSRRSKTRLEHMMDTFKVLAVIFCSRVLSYILFPISQPEAVASGIIPGLAQSPTTYIPPLCL